LIRTLDNILQSAAEKCFDKIAVISANDQFSYGHLHQESLRFAYSLKFHGIQKGDRICIFTPKDIIQVITIFGTWKAGGVIVPIRSISRTFQALHIIRDSGASVLVTTADRYHVLFKDLSLLPFLRLVVIVDQLEETYTNQSHLSILGWPDVLNTPINGSCDSDILANDMAAILYTSGSTGKPKGVILSHYNIVSGTKNVSQYLGINPKDRLLSILSFSFDYGLNQLTTTFYRCAQIILFNYLFAKDIIKAVKRYEITGLAAVSNTWIQLLKLSWNHHDMPLLRYITNTGGAIPTIHVREMRKRLPNSMIFLMYGFTEAFRSTYLDPHLVDQYPDSIGKAVPGQEILVLNKNNEQVKPGETGELVHRGSHVAHGYWGAPDKSAEVFKKNPLQPNEVTVPEIVAFSGDYVFKNEEGFLFFIGRRDDMIKSAGNRISPTEIEEIVYSCPGIDEVVALGIPHNTYGQSIFLVLRLRSDSDSTIEQIRNHCVGHMPPYMVPAEIKILETLPRNANGKLDRLAIKKEVYTKLGIDMGHG
jgi:acyl-CoA ligase (AMP-forming) (exosortase A-associated)